MQRTSEDPAVTRTTRKHVPHHRTHAPVAAVHGLLSRDHPEHRSSREAPLLDLAVLCERPTSSDLRSTLISALARATGRPIDLVDLERAGEPLLGEILKKGTRILSRDDSAYAELLRKHLFETADFLPYRNRILAERRRKWIGN